MSLALALSMLFLNKSDLLKPAIRNFFVMRAREHLVFAKGVKNTLSGLLLIKSVAAMAAVHQSFLFSAMRAAP